MAIFYTLQLHFRKTCVVTFVTVPVFMKVSLVNTVLKAFQFPDKQFEDCSFGTTKLRRIVEECENKP